VAPVTLTNGLNDIIVFRFELLVGVRHFRYGHELDRSPSRRSHDQNKPSRSSVVTIGANLSIASGGNILFSGK